MAGSAIRRTQQWATYGRMWYLYDAKWQDPYISALKIAKYLKGLHKPIFGQEVDCGDNVIIMNSYHIALAGDDWEKRVYFHDSGYRQGTSWTLAHELHRTDRKMIMKTAVYSALGGDLFRRPRMARLHIFEDEKVPEDLLKNVSNQIRQLRITPKRYEDYSQDEIDKFPKLFDWPKDHIIC